jgi:hypothetical protein
MTCGTCAYYLRISPATGRCMHATQLWDEPVCQSDGCDDWKSKQVEDEG